MLGIIPAVITPANGASSTMATIPSPTTQADLEALDEFLLSDRAPENSMGLSDLDGFLTGIIVGPELIMPSEWLPIIWGGDEPDFADIDEAQVVLGIIMARYNEIIAELDAGIDDVQSGVLGRSRGSGDRFRRGGWVHGRSEAQAQGVGAADPT